MMKKSFLALAVVSSCAAYAATAQETNPTFYVAAQVGGSSVTDMDRTATQGTGIDKNTTVWGLYGGLKFDTVPWLALEVGYVDLGKIKFDNANADFQASGFDFGAKFIHSVNEKFDVFARLGGIAYDWDANGDACCSDSDVSATVGLGGAYNFQENWSALLDYKFYNNIGGSPDFHTYNIGVQYTF
ncbi:outer membrane beta-barrel protein [Vibrio astriarenae]|uniref:Outer membrane beta-barrel protein n=1 Tax=Vibrio astriarenae TaxID=1481923 RepID=A0A7Z2T4Z0_9VIBR|nr:outer membrane beta-barrel protein [Vibrio astriarenae]QIA64416.1 outer membrane beta-barrel protein [Vibrio astriarenae]